jgi:hypothetical protein
LHYNEAEFVFRAGAAKGDDTMASDTGGSIADVSESRPWFKHYDPGVPLHLTYPRIPLYRLSDETAAKHPAAVISDVPQLEGLISWKKSDFIQSEICNVKFERNG